MKDNMTTGIGIGSMVAAVLTFGIAVWFDPTAAAKIAAILQRRAYALRISRDAYRRAWFGLDVQDPSNEG